MDEAVAKRIGLSSTTFLHALSITIAVIKDYMIVVYMWHVD